MRRERTRRHRLAVAAIALLSVGTALTAWALWSGIGRSPASDTFAWPTTGSAALSVDGRMIASPGADERLPIGSIAKLVTALVVLDRIPLAEGEAGPTFTLTDDDAAFAAQDPGPPDSLIPVTAGDHLSTRTLMEYVLIASSNTHARALAIRVFDSEQGYLSAARRWLDDHGLQDIDIADANGISEGDTATAGALVELGLIANASPIVREIVATPRVITPDGRSFAAANAMLGTLGIDGLKTGHPADGVYTMLFSAEVAGRRVIGAILGSPSIDQRSTDVIRLLGQVRAAAT